MADEAPPPPPAPEPAPTPTPPARAQRSGDVRWRGNIPPPPSAQAKNRSTLLVLLGIFLALAAAAAAFFFYLGPKPAPFLLTFPIREYKFRAYPVNFFADQDSSLLVRHFPKHHHKAFESQDRARLLLELANLKNKGDRPLIVHITALTRTKEGDVYLLPGDADPDDDATWLPLHEIINGLARCPAKDKLLVLDLAHPVASDPRLGILTDRVAEALGALFSKSLHFPLHVLCSTSPGQDSQSAEAVGQTAFAYYLDQALSGEADGYGPQGRVDRRITVTETADFVAARVDRWARQNTGLGQLPTLYGMGDNFVMVNLDDNAATSQLMTEAKKKDSGLYPDWLKKGFEKRDLWWRDGTFRRAPLVFQQLEANLVRLEQRWRGGFEVAQLQPKLQEVLTQLEDLVQQTKLTGDGLARSLKLAMTQTGGTKIESMAEVLRQTLPRVAAFEKPEDEMKAREAILKLAKDLKDVPASQQIWTLFETIADLPLPTPKHLAFTLQVIQLIQSNPKFVEVLYLQRLVDFEERLKDRDRSVWKWDAAQVAQLLRTMRSREQLASALQQEPALLPWIQYGFAEAEKQRRAGEQGFLWEHYSKWKEAGVALQLAGELYRQLFEKFDRLRRARKDMDEAFALLPGYAAFLRDLPGNAGDKSWRSAIQEAKKLSEFFAYPPKDARGAEESPPAFSGLNLSLAELKRLVGNRYDRVVQLGEDGGVSEVFDIGLLLKSPRLEAREREELWKTGSRLFAKLHQKTAQFDLRDQGASQTPAAQTPIRLEDRWIETIPLMENRARLSLDLLQLAGTHVAGPIEKQLEALGQPRDPKDFDGVAKMLQLAWGKEVVEQYRAIANEPAKADRLSRLLPPLEHDLDGILAQNPAKVLSQQHARQFRLWLGDGYRSESQFLKGAASKESPAAAQFFLEAAQELTR